MHDQDSTRFETVPILPENDFIQRNLIFFPNDILENFIAKIPRWGGKINYKGKSDVKLTNTCSIDYFLLALWYISKIQIDFFILIPKLEKTRFILSIIELIDQGAWNLAKEMWINQIIKHSETPTRNTLSMFNNEYDIFIEHLREFQSFSLRQMCTLGCPNNFLLINNDEDKLFFMKDELNSDIRIGSMLQMNCRICRSPTESDIRFHQQPNFVFIDSGLFFLHELPKELEINNKKFGLLCATIHVANKKHFVGIFNIVNRFYLIDDLEEIARVVPLVEYVSPEIIPRNKKGKKKQFNYYENVTTSFTMYQLIERG
jgi:hypothetical protein